jgi:hypothetical protein
MTFCGEAVADGRDVRCQEMREIATFETPTKYLL